MYGSRRCAHTVVLEIPEGKSYFEDLGVDWKIILQ